MTIFGTLAPHYWSAGLPAMPLLPASKKPFLDAWQRYCDAMPDADTRASWLAKFPSNNIGLALGPQSGVFILDIDSEDPEVVARIERLLPYSPWRRVGKKGAAIAFRWTEHSAAFKIRHPDGSMAVEGLGKGNQIVLPGSIHPDTKEPYKANSNLWEVLDQLVELPADIKRQLRNAVSGSVDASCARKRVSAMIPEGGRHNALVSQAGRLRNAGLSGEVLKFALQTWNVDNCNPPQDEVDIDRIVASADDWDANEIRPATDMGLGAMLADRLRGRACYMHEAKNWYFFDGYRWGPDAGNLIVREAKAVALDQAKRTELHAASRKGAMRAQSASAIKNMIELAKSEDGIMRSVDEFDGNRDLLNTSSGAVDLRTGQLTVGEDTPLFLQSTAVAFDPDAECPAFGKFLCEVLPDEEERNFIQRYFGYCLTGHTSEQKFLIASGGGANGKSTLLNLFRNMMGEYAQATPMSSFIQRSTGAATNDLAALRGARLVLANEGNRGQKLDTALLKQMVGGDPIRARFLHKEFFTYAPTFKPILISNHLPDIDPTDDAVWRRILALPFRVSFVGAEDVTLPDRLAEELPGILRWAVEGAVSWYQEA